VVTLRAVGVALLLAAALLAAGCHNDGQPKFESTDVTGAALGRELLLTAHDGRKVTLIDFRGKVLVVFFGFTHCPDVCPTALYKFATVLKALGPDAQRVQVVLVTVDPERDTPETLAQYVTAFDPAFLGLTGDADAIARTAREFRVVYEKQAGSSPDSYTVDHSSGAYVYDPEGRLRLYVSAQQESRSLEHDIRLLLAGK
jgi:protein SCO1/2